MTEAIPQDAALRIFLPMITGCEPTRGHWEIRWKLPRGGMGQDFIPAGEIGRAMRSVANRGQLTDTYVGVAPRVTTRGGLDAIEHVWALWADCDSPESLQRLARFDPLPSVVIRSGSEDHAHAYWPLQTALPPTWARRANRRLAAALGADRAATDAARILRPPLTLNHKHNPPRQVVCTRLEFDTFDLRDLIGDLPDDDPTVTPPPRRGRTAAPGNIAGLVRTVREAAPGSRNNVLFWAACRARESGEFDAAAAPLIEAAQAAGLSEHEATRTVQSAGQHAA